MELEAGTVPTHAPPTTGGADAVSKPGEKMNECVLPYPPYRRHIAHNYALLKAEMFVPLLMFYVRSGWVLTCDSAHSWMATL